MTTSSARKVLRRLTAGMCTGVLVASLSIVWLSLDATPASACSATLRVPFKLTSQVVATSITNNSCDFDGFTLDRHRWFGWQSVASKRIHQNTSTHITWNCAGVGTYTYRGRYFWFNLHGHESPHARLSC